MTGAAVRVDRIEDGTVLRVVIDHPKGNVLTGAVMRELGHALETHAGETSLRLVLLRGAGGQFSYGASVEEHLPERAPGMLRAFHAVARRLATFPAAVAALVEGRCLGGAFELALCCPFVFADPSAVFACPEIRLGVFPPVLAALGPSRIGASWTTRLLLTGAEIDAATAQTIGLCTAIAPDGADVETFAIDWYRRTLRPLSAYVLREGLAAARAGSGLADALHGRLPAMERRYLERVVPSHDGNEGIAAFLARRPPAWSDS